MSHAAGCSSAERRSAKRAESRVALRASHGRGLPPAQSLVEKRIVVREKEPPAPRWHLRCPHCEQFTLVVIARLKPVAAPPESPARAPP